MKKIAVIYKSKYGKTEQYAKWIAQALGASLFKSTAITPHQLNNYDVVIYGGGLYAGGIDGVKLVKQNPCKTLVVFTVGVAPPKDTNYTKILERAFTPEELSKIKVFHFRGGIEYSKLSFTHKIMMAIVKRIIEKQPPEKRDSDSVGVLETYGKDVDFSDKGSIEVLVEYVKGM